MPHNPNVAHARHTDPPSSHDAATLATTNTLSTLKHTILTTLTQSTKPMTLDEITNTVSKKPGQTWTQQNIRSRIADLKHAGHLHIVGYTHEPGKRSKVQLIDLTSRKES